jgi:hypothetical protein
LLAEGPAPAHHEALMQFSRLVGSWSLDVTYYAGDGSVRRPTPGEWHFAWVLEGRAVADVWMVPPRAQRTATEPPPGEYGMSLRFYDPRIGAWRSTWHGPVNGIVWPFIARAVGDEMVLERVDEAGELVRWIFSEIPSDSFRWRPVRSRDGGESWVVGQVMEAKRSTAQPGHPRRGRPDRLWILGQMHRTCALRACAFPQGVR